MTLTVLSLIISQIAFTYGNEGKDTVFRKFCLRSVLMEFSTCLGITALGWYHMALGLENLVLGTISGWRIKECLRSQISD